MSDNTNTTQRFWDPCAFHQVRRRANRTSRLKKLKRLLQLCRSRLFSAPDERDQDPRNVVCLLVHLMDPWKEIARNEQQQCLEIFGSTDWDVYRPEERQLLYNKVGIVIFGPPCTEYDNEQVAHIKNVTDVIIREDVHDSPEGTLMSIIILFVKPCGKKKDYYCHPVFRVPKYSGSSNKQHAFIDCIGRVYKSWNYFMENNKLPQSEICYPVNGVYRQDMYGQVVLGFGRTKSSMLLKVADGASNLLALGSLGVAATALVMPVAVPLVTAVSVGSAVGGIYGAARATQDLVDRKKHGQSIGLADRHSVVNWASIITAFTGVRSSLKCIRLSGTVSKSAKLGVLFGAACAVRSSSDTRPEMFRDVNGKTMLVQDVSSYILLFGHAVADAKYAVNFINFHEGNHILHVKSKLITKIDCGETVRSLEFVGIESGKLPDKFQLSFDCTVNMFQNIKDYVSGCINRILTVACFENIKFHMKVVIDFLSKNDLTWAIESCKTILSMMDCEKGEALLGIMTGFYYFLKMVIDMAQSGDNVPFPRLKFTAADIILVVKIFIAENDSFNVKFMKLYKDFIQPRLPDLIEMGSLLVLQKIIYPPNTLDLKSVPDEEIFKAAGDLVRVPLDSSKGKITHAGSEIFVIITDTNIEHSVVQIFQDKESGSIVASVLR